MGFLKVNIAEYAKFHKLGRSDSFKLADSTTIYLLSNSNRLDRLRVTDTGDLVEFASSRGPKQSIAKQLFEQTSKLMTRKK